MASSHSAALLLGGNLGNRLQLLHQALELIEQHIGSVALASPVYETAPWKVDTPLSFYNQAAIVRTSLAPIDLLRQALSIEHLLGRRRSPSLGYASRPMDIDIIFYDSLVLDQSFPDFDLTIPHPRMHLRRFVLVPLADIIPSFVHPLFHRSVQQLLDDCPDTSSVVPILPSLL